MDPEAEPIIVLVPILNFDCTTELIELDKSLLIRKVESVLSDVKFVVEKRGSSEKMSELTFGPHVVDAEFLITAMRLLEVGETPMLTAFYLSVSSIYVSDPYPKRYSKVNDYYTLSNEKIEAFRTLYKAQKDLEKKKPHLIYAIGKFNDSATDYEQEQFIDYITAFESIVFGRGTNAPAPYGRAIGIAIGMLIGKNEKERTKIEQRLNEAYEIRNKIVHGHLHNKIKDYDEEKFEELLVFTKECLIKSIIKLLKE